MDTPRYAVFGHKGKDDVYGQLLTATNDINRVREIVARAESDGWINIHVADAESAGNPLDMFRASVKA